MSVEDPSNRLRNPYALSGDEAWDPRPGNRRPSRAVTRLFATGGIGACAVAATLLGAGSAQADIGGGPADGGFGGGDDFGLGGGGLIDIPQTSTPSLDVFTPGSVASAPAPSTLSDTSTSFSNTTVLAATSPAGRVSTAPVEVAPSSTPVEGTGVAGQPVAVPAQGSTGWSDLTGAPDEALVVGEQVDPPDSQVAWSAVSPGVPLGWAEPGAQSSGSDSGSAGPVPPAPGTIGWSTAGASLEGTVPEDGPGSWDRLPQAEHGVDDAPTPPDTRADLLATTSGVPKSTGVPATEVPDSGAPSFAGRDDVVPLTTPPSAVADDAGLPAESPIMWSAERVPVARWMPDLRGSETPFAGADAAVAQGPGLFGSVDEAQQSSPGSGSMISTVRIGADDELADVTLGGPEQGAMVASLYTEPGRRRLQTLLSTERVVADRDELDLFVADVAGQLRGVAVNSTPLTQEQANLFYPVPAPEHPSLVNLPEAMKPGFQDHYDKINAADAQQAMASRSGFESPELACWVVCHRDGTSRVLPDLYIGGNSYVDGGASTVAERDLSDVTDAVLVHTHPLLVGADRSYDTSGLSAGDIKFLDTTGPRLAPHVDPAVASVSVLEGTVTVARRGSVPDGASSSVEEPEGGVRGPLSVRVLPSSPGSPVSSDIQIQVADTGTLDYSLADAIEAPGVSEQRYAAARRAAEVDLGPTALADPPDLYGPGVVPPEVWTTEGLRSRGLVVPPPASSIDLPLPASAADQSVDPEVGGSDAPSSTVPAPSDRKESEPATGNAPGGSSAGVVIRPDPGLTPEEQAGLGLIDLPGGWANRPPVELPDLNTPGGRPADPDELDPNWAQRQRPFVVPESWGGPETFPDRPEVDLQNDIWTFPLPPNKSPVGAERPRVEPTPSPPGGVPSPEAMSASPALQPGVPFIAGDTGWSSVAVRNPLAVQPARTATQPAGHITWSSRRATQTYTPPTRSTQPTTRAATTPAARPTTEPAPTAMSVRTVQTTPPATQNSAEPSLVQRAGQVLNEVSNATGQVIGQLVDGPVAVRNLDGDWFTNAGTTRYEASFVGGRTGVYDAETGRRLSGDGPATLPSWQIPVPPGAVVIPAAGAVQQILNGAGGLLQPQMP